MRAREHVTLLNLDASPSGYQQTLTTMAGHYATPEADTTITRHLPPPEDDSTQDVSMSFVIPPQADASNLLDQNYDDFFVGPGLVTLSTPVLPRHLTNISTRQSTRKVTRTIQTSAVVSSPILGRTIPTHSTTYPELPDGKAELPETHISPHPLPSLSPPTKPFMPTTLITEPGSPEKDPGAKNCDGLKSNPALPMASIITTKLTGKQPGIQSMSTSIPSRHSTNTQNTQISRRPPIPAPKKKTKGAAQPRETGSARSTQATSKHRSEIVLDRETTSVSYVYLCQPIVGHGNHPYGTTSDDGTEILLHARLKIMLVAVPGNARSRLFPIAGSVAPMDELIRIRRVQIRGAISTAMHLPRGMNTPTLIHLVTPRRFMEQ